MNLFPIDKISEYFGDYIDDSEFPIKSYPGFTKYLIAVKKFDKTSLRDMRLRFKEDIDLLNFIKAYCEGDLGDKSLLGVANASMSQFILKNKHGYVDRQELKQDVTYDKCYLPLKDESN